MRIYITDQDLCDLKDGKKTKRYGKYLKDKKFMRGLYMVFDIMSQVEKSRELSLYSFLHYEQLRGSGLSSVRIVNGMVERLLFKEVDDGFEVEVIELNTQHYGNKK